MGLFKKWARRKVVFIVCFLGLILFLYLAVSFLKISRAEIALAALEKSYVSEKICHEDCSLWRQAQEKIIVYDFKKVEKRILTYWQDPKEDLLFKKELIQIIFSSYGASNPPDYLKNYFKSQGAEPSLVREIISQFELEAANKQNLSDNLLTKLKITTSSTEKVEALKTLETLGGDDLIDNYFLILTSSEPATVKKEIIKNISAIHDKTNYFTLAQLAEIRSLILMSETDLNLRQELVLLIGDYYLVFPLESEKIWQEVFGKYELDSISRAFSADSLNHLAGTNLVLPAVTPSEWANYYNQ